MKAREYLAERGLKEEVLREFGVGMAPNRWDSVLLGGQQAGFKLDELFDGGAGPEGASGGRTTTSGSGSCSRSATSAGG